MNKNKIIVIGASGQIGTELTMELRKKYGQENVIASDIKQGSHEVMNSGPFEMLDVLDENRLRALIQHYEIQTVYLLAAILSGTAEKHPKKAWDLNMKSL